LHDCAPSGIITAAALSSAIQPRSHLTCSARFPVADVIRLIFLAPTALIHAAGSCNDRGFGVIRTAADLGTGITILLIAVTLLVIILILTLGIGSHAV
jgi:hypothetical protein